MQKCCRTYQFCLGYTHIVQEMDANKIGFFFWPESVKNTPKNGLWTLLGLTTSGLVGF
jgi:hypothetical protein